MSILNDYDKTTMNAIKGIATLRRGARARVGSKANPGDSEHTITARKAHFRFEQML
jgi:hypothetical protein